MSTQAQLLRQSAALVLNADQKQSPRTVMVPERVAILVRPILDELEKYSSDKTHGHERRIELFYALTKKKGPLVDEALVVLMCFEVMGESQEETDIVIERGRRMLPYINKYRDRDPTIPGRQYPRSLLKGPSNKSDDFQGATKAIKHGWRGTWDNPEG